MKRVIKRFITLALLILPMQVSSMKSWTTGNNGISSGWTVLDGTTPGNETSYNDDETDFSAQYLTFIPREDGNFKFVSYSDDEVINKVQYSLDGGITWKSLPNNTKTQTVRAGQKIMWKSNFVPVFPTKGDSYCNGFVSYCKIDIEGNIMSLVYSDSFQGKTSLAGTSYIFDNIFSACDVINAKNLILPATTLGENSYSMMFEGCGSLITAPKLPATELAELCYYCMFSNCTSLTTAPQLPATTLAKECYHAMFSNCTSLTIAPELPATTLVRGCYHSLFADCSRLNYIKCLATDISAKNCTKDWVKGVASSGTFVKTSSMSSWTTGNNGIPSGWSINETESGTTNSDNDNPQPGGNNEGSDSDTSGNYLTFVAIDSGTFKLSVNAVSYSLDNGRTWTTLASNTNSPTVQSGKKIMWKGALTPIEDKGIGKFSSSGQFDIEGNIMSLLYDDNFEGVSSLAGKDYAFSSLFSGCTGLISAENLVLPATTLAKNCYMCMFLDCSSLTTVPELPATTLADGCYSGMFGKCTSLTSVPSNYLPVTTLANSCYNGMFHNCTSLTTAPMLPATTLATSCYQYMFTHCTSLTTAPVLPATTLANSCYDNMFCYCTSLTTAPSLPATTVVYYCYLSMFYGCTSLTTAPELPATTLAVGCYELMFAGCSRLNYINCLATNISSKYCTDNWVQGVSSSGTFVKAPSASWTTGNNGIPSGWSVYDTESGTTNSDNDGNDAYAFKINGINYKIVKGNNVEVTGADWETSYKGTITIPSSVSYNGTGYSVVGIGAQAFYRTLLHSISLPSSVVSIGKEAFSYCSELSSITLSDNLKSIGDDAFFDSGLKTIAIPNSVSSIGEGAFSCCPISEIIIPNSVTTMGGYVLAHCDNLKSVILSNSIKELPQNCFYNCDELTSITIPVGVEKISFSAFYECKKLQSVFIPNTVKEIGNGAFWRCYSLVSIEIPNSVTSIGIGAFQECENLKYVNLPDNITTLPEDLFEKCISLESIDLPNGIWKIGEGAFYKCSSLKTIILPEKLKRIENHVFSNCISLETAIIPKNVNYVGSTFRNCKNLLNVYCYATEVPDIYDSAFEGADVVYAKLYVPRESVNQYKKAPTWSDFGVILPIEGDYNDISTTSQSSILIHNDGNTIVVEGLVEEAPVTIYNLSGQVVYSEQAVKGNIRIETNMRAGEAAIIKIGDLTRKTIIK